MRVRLSPPRVLLPHTYTQDGWFLQPERRHSAPSDWLERDCVSIDPCFQESSNEDHYALPAPAGVWLSGNSSALLLPLVAELLSDAEAGVRAENYGSLEFSRVPEGLKLQACALDFDLWRREGMLACNEKTLVSISADTTAHVCPGTRAHSLLDYVGSRCSPTLGYRRSCDGRRRRRCTSGRRLTQRRARHRAMLWQRKCVPTQQSTR